MRIAASRARRTGGWLLAWLGCTVASLTIFGQQHRAPIHPDEIYWIGSAYYYHLAFQRGDWTHPDWRLLSARENPPVAKYVMGLGLALAGQRVVTRDMLGCFRVMFRESPGAWGSGDAYAKRAADVGAMNPASCARPLGGPGVTNKAALLSLSRRVMVVCMALASLALFLLGASIANRVTGLLASQLLLMHPIAVDAYSHAMADAVALLFSAVAAGTTWYFARRLSAREPVKPGAGAVIVMSNGVALALACGAKMNALIMVLVFSVTVVAVAIDGWRDNDRKRALRALRYGAATIGTAFVAFTLLNPAMLADFPGALVALFQEPRAGLEITMQATPELRLRGLASKLGVVTRVAMGPLAFALAATISLVIALRSRRAGLRLVAAWWLIAVAAVTLWIPIAWPRYVLPVVAPSVLLVAFAVVAAAEAGVRAARARSRSALTEPPVP